MKWGRDYVAFRREQQQRGGQTVTEAVIFRSWRLRTYIPRADLPGIGSWVLFIVAPRPIRSWSSSELAAEVTSFALNHWAIGENSDKVPMHAGK